MTGCVFCEIVAGRQSADVIHWFNQVIIIRPLNPVTGGHLLVISKSHVTDYRENPTITAEVAARAAQVAPYPSNLITSAGAEATQTVDHLHMHIVPRSADDGLALPWSEPR